MATRIDISGIPEILRLLGSAPETPPQAARRREIFGDEEVVRGEMPLSPGSLLGVARRVPDWLRRIRQTLMAPQARPSTARTGNVLQQTVLSDDPSLVSRRAFFTDPLQSIVDASRSLGELGGPEGVPRWSRRFGPYPWHEELERAQDVVKRIDAVVSDRSGIPGDIESIGRIWSDQALKDAAKAAGESYEEAKSGARRRELEPGPVAKTAEGVRRRFGRRQRP